MRAPALLPAACLLAAALAGCGSAGTTSAASAPSAGGSSTVASSPATTANPGQAANTGGNDPCDHFSESDAEQVLPGYSLQRISKPGQMLCSWAHDGSTSEAVAFINDGDSTVAQNECLGEDPLAGLGQQACQHEEIGKLGPTEHLVTVQWLSANGHHYSVMASNDHPQPDLLARAVSAARAIESRLG